MERVASADHTRDNTMSDMETDRPSDATIAQKLDEVVLAIHEAGNPDDLTVKRVRARAEKELSLSDGFLKRDSSWKQKSQDAINDAFVSRCCVATIVRANQCRKSTVKNLNPSQAQRKSRHPNLHPRKPRRRA
jgi:rRNA maturation protein Rpf1